MVFYFDFVVGVISVIVVVGFLFAVTAVIFVTVGIVVVFLLLGDVIIFTDAVIFVPVLSVVYDVLFVQVFLIVLKLMYLFCCCCS